MLVNGYRAAGKGAAEAALLQLPVAVADRHGIVLVHHPLGLHREDPVQIRTRGSAKRGSVLWSHHRKLLIELCDIALPQERIGLLHRGDARQSKLLRQPPLPGAKAALT